MIHSLVLIGVVTARVANIAPEVLVKTVGFPEILMQQGFDFCPLLYHMVPACPHSEGARRHRLAPSLYAFQMYWKSSDYPAQGSLTG